MENSKAVFTQLLLAGVWPPVTTGWERLSLTLCDSCDEPLTYMVISVPLWMRNLRHREAVSIILFSLEVKASLYPLCHSIKLDFLGHTAV